MNMVIAVIMYAVEMVKYKIACDFFVRKKVRINPILNAGILIVALTMIKMMKLEQYQAEVITYACVVFITVIYMGKDKKDNLKKIFKIFLILSCFDEFFLSLLRILVIIIQGSIINSIYQELICSVLTLISISILLFAKRKFVKGDSKFYIRNNIQYIIYLMTFGMLLTITTLEYSSTIIKNTKYYIGSTILCCISYLGIEILILFSFYLKNSNFKLEEEIFRNQQFYNMEKKYYELLLQKDFETKKLRHDLHNHYLCLEAFLADEKLDEAKNYLNHMQNNLKHIQEQCFFTGDKILDIVTNYYLKLLPPNISVGLTGKVYTVLKIDDTDLCTIYANILENAVEELLKLEEGKSGFLNILIHSGKEFTEIAIENTTSNKPITFQTTKEDRNQHGFGLQNVKETIEKCNGIIHYEAREESFYTRFIVK